MDDDAGDVCFGCSCRKQRADFAISQWKKKRRGLRRCLDCCAVCHSSEGAAFPASATGAVGAAVGGSVNTVKAENGSRTMCSYADSEEAAFSATRKSAEHPPRTRARGRRSLIQDLALAARFASADTSGKLAVFVAAASRAGLLLNNVRSASVAEIVDDRSKLNGKKPRRKTRRRAGPTRATSTHHDSGLNAARSQPTDGSTPQVADDMKMPWPERGLAVVVRGLSADTDWYAETIEAALRGFVPGVELLSVQVVEGRRFAPLRAVLDTLPVAIVILSNLLEFRDDTESCWSGSTGAALRSFVERGGRLLVCGGELPCYLSEMQSLFPECEQWEIHHRGTAICTPTKDVANVVDGTHGFRAKSTWTRVPRSEVLFIATKEASADKEFESSSSDTDSWVTDSDEEEEAGRSSALAVAGCAGFECKSGFVYWIGDERAGADTARTVARLSIGAFERKPSQPARITSLGACWTCNRDSHNLCSYCSYASYCSAKCAQKDRKHAVRDCGEAQFFTGAYRTSSEDDEEAAERRQPALEAPVASSAATAVSATDLATSRFQLHQILSSIMIGPTGLEQSIANDHTVDD